MVTVKKHSESKSRDVVYRVELRALLDDLGLLSSDESDLERWWVNTNKADDGTMVVEFNHSQSETFEQLPDGSWRERPRDPDHGFKEEVREIVREALGAEREAKP